MPEKTYTVRGLDCPDCAAALEKAAANLPYVASARLAYSTGQLTVDLRNVEKAEPALHDLSRKMGYRLLEGEATEEEAARPITLWGWVREHREAVSTVASALFAGLGFLLGWLGGPLTAQRVLFAMGIVVGGYDLARAGWTALRTAHTLDMNALMTVAAIGAMLVGEFAEGAMTILLFSIGELLEGYTGDRARNAIRSLMELAPDEATVLEDGQTRVLPVGDLHLGRRVLVRPGERLPVDGRVLEGTTEVNQAPITGESVPAPKTVGDVVFAGTINGAGALTVEVTRVAEDSTIARILHMVEQAQSERAPAQRWVDRFAAVYTPVVFGLAFLVAFAPPLLGLGALNAWVYRALVLLVIACPCALVISTPVTLVSALARAARGGVLVKGGRHLEALAALRVFAFDKTGTLTEGLPRVVGGSCEFHPEAAVECATCNDLLAKAAALEARSEHSLAQAVVRQATAMGVVAQYLPGEQATAYAGLGIQGLVEGHEVSAGSLAFSRRNGHGGEDDALYQQALAAQREGHTIILIEDACCSQRCFLAVSDGLRENAAESLVALKHAGIDRTVMLTGDNKDIAGLIAKRAGVDEYLAELLPEDKVAAVERLERTYGATAMVGDGVNDAPALAKATVGIAMGAAGTDTALETADVALMGDDLGRLPFAVGLSRSALGTVRANVAMSLAIKGLFLALAVAGISTLWMAVLADTGVSILVTLNGMRLLGYRDRPRRAALRPATA